MTLLRPARTCVTAWWLASLLNLGAIGLCSAEPGEVHVLGDDVQAACTQPRIDALTCRYRLLTPGSVQSVSATLDGVTLASSHSVDDERAVTAVLFLVDTSDPGRSAVVRRNIEHIRMLLDTIGEGRHVGLAAFDSDLRMLAPLGSVPNEVKAAADTLRAAGRTTELYRNTLRAVQALGDYPADWRALFLLSDGLAEDKAYFHQDVIDAARTHGVAIFGIGYARSAPLSVALQSLRRLAEETGGDFVAADQNLDLPRGFSSNPLQSVNGGARLAVDLGAAIEAGAAAERTVDLVWHLEQGRAHARIPVVLPPPRSPEPIVIEKPVIIEKTVEKTVEVPVQTVAPTPVSASREPGSGVTPRNRPVGNTFNWYAGLAGGLLLLLLLLIGLLWRVWHKPRAAPAAPANIRTFGFLETQDGSQRYAISSAAFRIGRHADNDLTLNDASISRHHAEIHRRRDGSFTITDLDSMNGVFVNDKQQKKAELGEGDLIELGDVALRFSIQREDQLDGDETVILRTVAPSPTVVDNKDAVA